MFRYLRYAFLALLAIVLITVALANHQMVELHLLPGGLADITGTPNTAELPLFLVIFGAIVAGLLIGFIWEWLREHRIRAEAARARREAQALKREVEKLKGRKGEKPEDEILALLEDGATAR